MNQKEPGNFFQTGPFRVTGEHFVIAANTGDGFGNTVARCFPIREGDKEVTSAAEIALLLANLLNEEVKRRAS